MAEFYPGQQIRIKSEDEIANEYGYTIDDFQDNGITIGNIEITYEMADYFGQSFIVSDADNSDNSLYIITYDGDSWWWPFELVELVSEPGEYFGFKVGDSIEFVQYEIMKTVDWFVPSMVNLCGTTGTIMEIHPMNGSYAEIVVSSDDDGRFIEHELNTNMVEHVDTSPEVEVDGWAAVMGF